MREQEAAAVEAAASVLRVAPDTATATAMRKQHWEKFEERRARWAKGRYLLEREDFDNWDDDWCGEEETGDSSVACDSVRARWGMRFGVLG